MRKVTKKKPARQTRKAGGKKPDKTNYYFGEFKKTDIEQHVFGILSPSPT